MPVIAIPRNGLTRFERLYFFETDGEENQRTNIRKVTVDDGTDDVDTETSDSDMDDDEDDTEEDTGGGEDSGENAEDDTDDDVDLEADDSDMEDDGGGGEDEDKGNTDSDDGGDDGGDVDLENDDKDMSDDGGDSEDSGSSDSDGEDSENSDADTITATKKRALFSRINELHTEIGTYAEKLNSLMTTASDNVVIYRNACDELDELATYVYDFMIIRFKNATYTEAMLLYQRAITAVSLILDELHQGLDKIRRETDEDGTKKQNSKPKKPSGNPVDSLNMGRAP